MPPPPPQSEGYIPPGGGPRAFRIEEWDQGPLDGENGECEICVRGLNGPCKTLYVEMVVGGCPQMAVIDTGAQVTLLSDAMAGRIGVPSRVLADLPRVKLRGFSQDGSVEGKRGLWVTFKVGSKEMSLTGSSRTSASVNWPTQVPNFNVTFCVATFTSLTGNHVLP